MLLIGSKGHAKEVLEVLNTSVHDELVFFDNVSEVKVKRLFGIYKILTTFGEAEVYFKNNSPKFCPAIGSTHPKKKIVDHLELIGGQLESIIAKDASVGDFEVEIGQGANIMKQVLISNSVTLGKAVMVNFGASVHHDCMIGDYCEISPKASILGRCKLGNFVSVGAGATILPDIEIGDNVIIGAGAVVTKSIKSNSKVAGIPAKPM